MEVSAMGKLLDAVQSGDKRDMLIALRDSIASTIDNTVSGRDVAALSKRLMEVYDTIESMPSPDDETNPVDELAEMIAEYDDYEDPRFDDEDGG
jgi:hypothetical protein